MTSPAATGGDGITALVVEIPEAEELYGRLLDRWQAPPGMAAHVTVLVPFGQVEEDELGGLFAAFAPFAVRFRSIGRFPDVVYLEPEPARLFVELTEAVASRWPEFPPYRGVYPEIVPHLTIVNSSEASLHAAAAAAVAGALPIGGRAEEVALYEQGADGIWRRRAAFRLGQSASSS